VNDAIERKLLGDIDTRGAHAVRAFVGENAGEWHRLRIPIQSGRGFRFDPGHHSDLMPAAIPK
jgi:hypothetical protein